MANTAVLGAGNGGMALAAILKKTGHRVCLWNRSEKRVATISSNKRIRLTGSFHFHVIIDKITCDLKEAIVNAEYIFIVVPANAHFDIAKNISPYIKKNQVIVLNPGRTMGFLEIKNALLLDRSSADMPTIMETQSLFCACRYDNKGTVNILSFKKDNYISCHPGNRFDIHKGVLSGIYKNLIQAPSPFYTGFENIGAILHPAPVLLNTGWIESRDVFFPHYYYGISRSIATFIEMMDEERLRVAKMYGAKVRSVKKWHEDNYGTKGKNLFETLQKNSAYASIDAPRTLRHRYITEDIPTGLVPISELGYLAGVETPLIDLVIQLGNSLLQTNFRENGRNLKRLGLEGKTTYEIKKQFE